MDIISFSQLASSTGCRSREWAKTIRENAENKGDKTDLQGDEKLLFTPRTLRLVFDDAASIADLLECSCDRLCKQHNQRSDKTKDANIAQTFAEDVQTSTEKLDSLAVLVLSGCSFALRPFGNTDFKNLRDYTAALLKPTNDDLCDELLGPLKGDHQILTKSEKDALRHTFIRDVQAVSWLVNVPTFTAEGVNPVVLRNRSNLPFLNESFVGLGNRGNKRFTSFDMAENYSRAKVLKQTLFRKQFIIPNQSGTRDQLERARAEVAMLDKVNTLGCKNIARMLLAFHERPEPGDGVHKLSIVFAYHAYHLGDILHAPDFAEKLKHFPNASPPRIQPSAILAHGLWKAMTEIVEAVIAMHTQMPNSYIGHFDIKPANILIEVGKQPDFTRLLLTDFGQAFLVDLEDGQTTGREGYTATAAYAPPERRSSDYVRRSVDLWSLGCVLLEVLVLLAGDRHPNAAITFQAQRRSANPSGAFWATLNDTKMLSKIVQDRLDELRAHQEIKTVVERIQVMLSVEPASRKIDLASAWKDFRNRQHTVVATPIGHQQLMRDLPERSTSCNVQGSSEPASCKLHYFRDFAQNGNVEVSLYIEIPGSQTILEKQKVSRASEYLLPAWLFDPRPEDPDNGAERLRCAFRGLHSDKTLYFSVKKDFFDFMALTTQQTVVKSKNGVGLDIHFAQCRYWKPSRFPLKRGTAKTKNGGRVQLWSTLSSADYDENFLKPVTDAKRSQTMETTSRNSEPVSVKVRIDDDLVSRFKLAMFFFASGTSGAGASTSGEYWVIDIHNNAIRLGNCTEDASIVRFEASKRPDFHVATSSQPGQGTSFAGTSCPGIPLSPSKMETYIRDSKMRLESFELRFAHADAAKEFRELLGAYNVM